MELTREILDQITKDATFARDIESIIVSVHPKTVQALVAEIERQREEIAALRGEIESLRAQDEPYYGVYDSTIPDADDNTPAPEPAPRKFKVGDRVVANSHAIEGMRGTIVDVAPGVNRIAPYRVHIDNMSYDFQLKEAEIELAND